MRLVLNQQALDALTPPVEGEGEFQHLIRKLQRQVMGNMLLVSELDFRNLRLWSYADVAGEFHERAAAIVHGAAEEAGEEMELDRAA